MGSRPVPDAMSEGEQRDRRRTFGIGHIRRPFILRPRRDHPADGGDHAGRHRRIPLPADLPGVTGSRLPNHPGTNFFIRVPSPEVMTSSVTSPLEVQFGQMPSLNQMFSTSSAGASVITLAGSAWTSAWTSPSRSFRRRSTRPAICCLRICRRRRSMPRSIRPTHRS